ncbi:hypothetical protein SAMN05421504_10321 [Amycolatopsis xylanica]|uniref:Uncharacterized protein n=1 Tax=Amycolatopsis xylanica TaxID=589385 RepID=A0A1H3CGD9_9PSEU|nr:hypothetical protein [Amycolatopsis xylanica]SDX52978.1 hypothetical protein SAMN05421504_10321 [Amycolatopsis xylanica]
MTEQLEQDLRALSFTEPPLGFDTEAVATKAAARQRKRLVAASGLGTLAAVVAIVATTVVPSGVVQPAADPVTTVSVPPVEMPLTLLREHLPALLKAVQPDAKNIVEVTTPEMAIAMLRFRYDLNGRPARIEGNVGRPILPGGREPVPCPAGCTNFPQPDGSEVHISQSGRFVDGATGAVKPSTLEARHYRLDGTQVEISVAFLPPAGEGVPMTYEQVIRIATDPSFDY